MYKHIPNLEMPKWDVCPRCTHFVINIPFHQHKELCDYFYFRNFEAKELGYTDITKVQDSYYTKITLEALNIPHRAFQISGMAGHYWDIYLSNELAGMIDLYYMKEGYAGMSLEDFLKASLEQ